MVSASDRALRPFEPSAIALKAAAGIGGAAGRQVCREDGPVRSSVAAISRTDRARVRRGIRRIPQPDRDSCRAVAIPSFLRCSIPDAVESRGAGFSDRVGVDYADAEGLILFGVSTSAGGGGYCTVFYTINPDGSGERQLAPDCLAFYGRASWSPTGDDIVIDSTPLSSSTTQIYRLAADGGALRPLVTLKGGDTPAFSPDGSQIAYSGLGSAPGATGIFIAASDGTQPHQLTSPAGTDFQPRFSPDGTRLVFSRDGTGIWMVNTDGTDLHQLTAALAWSMDTRWSPDGSHLLFTGSETGDIRDEGLWTIDADGTGLTPIGSDTGGPSRDKFADWSPDGTRIVYTYILNDLAATPCVS